MTRLRLLSLLGLVALVAAACAPMASTPQVAMLKDGELPVPANYRAWPKFLSEVQRPDAKQVREIYMNTAAGAATPAAGFPNGTVFVMENYAAAANADGSLKQGADGKLVKGDLLRVFVMGKNAAGASLRPRVSRTATGSMPATCRAARSHLSRRSPAGPATCRW